MINIEALYLVGGYASYGIPFSAIASSLISTSNDFAISVRWMNVDSNMYSEPIAYEQKGLKLKELEYGDTLGSLFPEYFELYYLVDKANTNWSNWGNKEKYEFLEELDNHTKKRSFEISDNLMQLLNKHRNEGAK